MDTTRAPLLENEQSSWKLKCICAAVLLASTGCVLSLSSATSLSVKPIHQRASRVNVIPTSNSASGQYAAFAETPRLAQIEAVGSSSNVQHWHIPTYLAPLISSVAAAVAVYFFKVRTVPSAAGASHIEWPLVENALFATSGEKTVEFYGPNRNLFLGPLNDTPPAYLKGELPGDYGYDILGLAENPKRLEQYRQGEIINGRWAMLGVVGCLAPELLAKFGGVEFPEPVWFKTGAQIFSGDGIDYLGNPSLVHAQSITAILVTELLLIGAVEAFRAGGGPLGPAPADPVYPGKLFDPLGLANDPAAFAELKVKEVKNGRLAMMAFLGFAMQGFATGKGPVQNWLDHLADPANVNIVAYHQQVLSQIGGVAMF